VSAVDVPTTGLDALFSPRGVAVLGASTAPAKLGAVMLRSLRGYRGPVFGVNARTPDAGQQVYATIADGVAASGAPPDLVVSCVPAAATPAALREAAAAGARAALVCAGGFAEAGGQGQFLQDELAALVEETGLRLLGPNTSGFLVPHAGLAATFVPGVAEVPDGPVAVVAASGGVNHALAFALAGQGTGVRLAVGLGNSVDVTSADVLAHLVKDAGVRAVALHIESVADGQALVAAVEDLAARVPVVALVVGRSDVGAFARSHTGALATSWRTTRAALRQAGAVLVDDERAVVDAVRTLARTRLPASPAPGIGLITAQAGPGLLLADGLRSAGVDIPDLDPRSVATIGTLLPPLTYQRNPVDTGRPDPTTLPEVVRAVAADGGVDAVGVYALLEPDAYDLPSSLPPSPGVPMVVVTGGPPATVADTLANLERDGVPSYSTPASGVTALRALADDARAAWLREESPAPPPRGAAHVPSSLDEDEAKALVAAAGVPALRRHACSGREQAHAALAELGGPVVVKLLDADVLHKTEVGGVHLGVRTPADLDGALDALAAAGARRVLVEQMATAGPELLLGARRDPVFGPVVVLGLGGTTAEALADVAVRLAPLSRRQARGMLDDLEGRAVVEGFRGAAAVDRDALADAVVGVAGLLAASPALSEVEVNPLRVLPDGSIVALDAIVRTDREDTRA
jgi:acyl-CoA synthetase (NDP forming)